MNYLELQEQMPAHLKALYRVRGDWTRTLSNFRAYRNLWKCSVLNGGAEDEQASDIAENCWQQLRSLRKKLVKMHRDLGFAESENELFELPREEYSERIEIGEAPETPARMPSDIKELLASVLEPGSDWKEDRL